MKKKIWAGFCAAIVGCVVLGGCGGQSAQEKTVAQSDVVVQESQAVGQDAALTQGGAQDVGNDVEKAQGGEQHTAESQSPAAEALEDGIYSASFDTDSSMFSVNETQDGKGVLTVENGQMTIHISLRGKKILNLYPGLAEDAQKEGAALLEPTTDTVTYSDGLSEEVYGFDIPVPVLDEEFDVALIGEKGKWYDHKVKVSKPEKIG